MNHELLKLVRCPDCRGELEIRRDRPGALTCRTCGRTFPIRSDVPRLAGGSYVASFGRQWNRYDVARPEEDESTFQVKTGVSASELAGRLVLDAGCGGGRYTRLVSHRGARVVGVDLSEAVEKAAALCADQPEVLIIQADLL